jgi:hypothetical protein
MKIKLPIKSYILSFFFLTALLPAQAQPGPVKKGAQSVFVLTTFNADGSIHSSSHGVFVGQSGVCLSLWSPLKGADKAVVVDAKGRKYDVDVMMGVSELYNLCQFRIKGKGPDALATTTSDVPLKSVYLIGYDLKKPDIKKLNVERSEKFMSTYNYYVFNDNDVSSTALGCPIVNDAGQLLGIMQRPANGGQAYSADARLASTFKLNGLSINDPTLSATGIRTALPNDEEQATLMLMLAGQKVDSTKYAAYLDDFIAQFPNSAEGYSAKARSLTAARRLKEADEMFNLGVKRATNKDEAYSEYAKTVYEAAVLRTDTTFTEWNLKRAETLAQEAYKIRPLPVYRHQEAQAIYAEGDVQKALDIFTELQKTDLGKNGEVYYEAAQCKSRLKAPQSEIMALLDSAVNVQQGMPSAPYVLARGREYDGMGETRKAFKDYLTYDSLMNNNGTSEFYYIKYKCEMKLRQFQLALNDIAHAIVLNRTEPTYYAEMASVQLRVNKLEDAIRTCDLGLQLTQNYADLYIIKGMSLCGLKRKAEGLECFNKAKELGDSRAQGLIDKFK